MVTRTWGPEIHALYDSVGDDARFVASFAGLRQAIQAQTMVLVSARPIQTTRCATLPLWGFPTSR